MSIRTRLILVLLLVGVVPTLIAVFGATAQVQNLAVRSSRATLEELAKTTIRDKALSTAQQIQSHLLLHSEVDLSDVAALKADQGLAVLAVQPVGQTGYTAVFDDEAITHFHANSETVGVDMSTLADPLPEFWAIFSASLDGYPSEGYYDWQEADGSIRRKFMAIVPVGDTQLRVAATTYVDEFAQPAQALTAELERQADLARFYFSLFSATVGLIVLVVAFYAATWFTAPLQEMALAAGQVVQGEWDAIRPSTRRDEIGALNRAFHSMTLRLKEMVQRLEQEVATRTVDLERRSRYLEATAKVARDATSLLDLEKLFPRIVASISEQFDFHRIGIFLLDPSGEWAVLRAASGEGGQRTLAHGLRLKVGGEGIVGYVTGTGKPYVAPDVSEDPLFIYDSDVADTRSEMVLPLRARGEIIGALDAQSAETEAFNEEDVAVLQTLADQIATVISNAQLFQQVQKSLEAERLAYGELSREAWAGLLQTRPDLGFARDERGLSPVSDTWGLEMETALRTGRAVPGQDGATGLAQPIKVRGHVIGVIDAQKSKDSGAWSPEQIALLETLSDQLGAALESARLYQDTQRRAVRERLTGEVTAHIRETLDMDTVLKTAAQEVRQALGLPEVVIRLGTSPPSSRSGRDELAQLDGEERIV
ncbi:MAG: GAF domain-containing protein [Chloroflexota bacterium]|nr:GAF domain-containing protein [Chloroflexota bacterium]